MNISKGETRYTSLSSIDDFEEDRRPLPISDHNDDDELVHAHEMLCSNIVLVRKGDTLHIIQRKEAWIGHGPLYACGYSSVLLTLVIWNILSLTFTLIISVIGFRCLLHDKECRKQQVWVALLVLAGGIMASALLFTMQYGAPYFRDTVYDVSPERVTRVHVWPLFNLRKRGGKKRTIRVGQVSLKLPPQCVVEVSPDYEIRGVGPHVQIYKLVFKDHFGQEIILSSPNLQYSALRRLRQLVVQYLWLEDAGQGARY